MTLITLVQVDDWVAVYNEDGKKVWSNHSCGLKEGLEALGIPFRVLSPEEEDPEYDIENSTVFFPQHIEDYSQ